ncbi:MAG: hypothetical protein SGBAC_005717, partial [Bacillariaceae sp.]
IEKIEVPEMMMIPSLQSPSSPPPRTEILKVVAPVVSNEQDKTKTEEKSTEQESVPVAELEVKEEEKDSEQATEQAVEAAAPTTEEAKQEEEGAPMSAEEAKKDEKEEEVPKTEKEDKSEIADPKQPSEEYSKAAADHQAAIHKALATDYSTAVAKGRLLVSRAIEFLANIASENPEEFGVGCRIETAMSGKTWRHQYRPDRREGTIESTNEYKSWLNSLTKKKEELDSRPKPAPGGGAANTLVGLVDSSAEESPSQPMAAIVQHLRAKRQELKRKKTKKKKEKNEKAGGGKNINNNNNNNKKKAAPAGGAKKKKKKGGKKKQKPTAVVAPPPTALLKPTSGGISY